MRGLFNRVRKMLVKRNFPLAVKENFRKNNRRLTALFLGIIMLLGIGRIGWISIVKSEYYRGLAEDSSYKELVVEARRGSIYASDMSIMATSYPVWNLCIDPSEMYDSIFRDARPVSFHQAQGSQKKKLEEAEATTYTIEIYEKYLHAVAAFLNYVLNDGLKPSNKDYISEEDIYAKLTTYTSKDDETKRVKYAKIRDDITTEQKQKIETVLKDCYYNYVLDQFYKIANKEETEPKSMIQKILGKVKSLFSKSTTRVYYQYDYKKGEFVSMSDVPPIAGRCIIREYKAFIMEESTIRSYSENGLGSSFIGFVDKNGDAQYGVEKQYDKELSGVDGIISGLAVSGNGTMVNASDSSENDVKDGYNLILTVNPDVQRILEDNLKSTYKKYSADETFGCVMDVNTGAVLAMSNYPNYDLNDPFKVTEKKAAMKKAEQELMFEYEAQVAAGKKDVEKPTKVQIQGRARINQWSCFCVNYPYELGSTFKLFTASAGLEEGILDTDNFFYGCGGSIKVADKTISCSHGTAHGSLSMSTAIAKSCNAFFIRLGLNLGKTAFNKYFKSFGFTEKTGIDIFGEQKGQNYATEKMSSVELASTAFGQTATITGIQLITGVSAIANGGNLLTPYIVDRITDKEGNIVSKHETEVKRRVVSEETCNKVKEMMKGVVYSPYGTAYHYIDVPGYTIAGKTGSGEIQGKGGSTGDNGYKYTASFVGIAPAENPEIAILIGIRNPEGGYLSGGQIAAPVAGKVLSYALSALDIESPSGKVDDGKAPDVIDYPLFTAKKMIGDSGYICKVYGTGQSVLSQNIEPGEAVPESGIIALFTDTENHDVEVPDLIGLTKSEALNKAREAGINISCQSYNSDGDVVVRQTVKTGEKLKPGSIVTVYFGAQND